MFFENVAEDKDLVFRECRRMHLHLVRSLRQLKAHVEMIHPPRIGRQFIYCYWMLTLHSKCSYFIPIVVNNM